ncbi:hypothetical protein WCLP8_510012 [uncultured Gammaproteobacteria bacterium]
MTEARQHFLMRHSRAQELEVVGPEYVERQQENALLVEAVKPLRIEGKMSEDRRQHRANVILDNPAMRLR